LSFNRDVDQNQHWVADETSRNESRKALKSRGVTTNNIGEIDRILEDDQILECEIQKGDCDKPKSARNENYVRSSSGSIDNAKVIENQLGKPKTVRNAKNEVRSTNFSIDNAKAINTRVESQN
jgi:hypothetical protein